MSLSVVIAAFNEEDNVVPLLDEVARALADIPEWEVVVVDDGSTDATAARLRAAGERNPALVVVRHARNRGQSAAVASGVRAARHRVVATLDGDGQNDPADVPQLYREFCDAGDALALVVGNRRRRRDTWLRRLSSRAANGVRSRLLGDRCPDTGCGLKVFNRDTFLELPKFDHMHRFLPALYQRAGGRVVNVPVNHRPRSAGRSKYGVNNRLWVGIVDLFGVMWLTRRPCPTETPRADGD